MNFRGIMKLKDEIQQLRLKIFKDQKVVDEFHTFYKANMDYKKAVRFFEIKTRPDDPDAYYVEKRKLKSGTRITYKLKPKYYDTYENEPRRWSPTAGTRIQGWSIDSSQLHDLVCLIYYILCTEKIVLSDAAKISGVKIQTIKKRKNVLMEACNHIHSSNKGETRSFAELTRQVVAYLLSKK